MKAIKNIFLEIRPIQWIKNLFLFAGLIFSFSFTRLEPTLQSIYGFILFCLASSSIYIFNDIIDKEMDMSHPKKRKRPIASGEMNTIFGLSVSIILALISMILALFLNRPFFYSLIAYFLLMILYSLGLKKIIIIDVICISFGFILRAVAGAVVIGVEISPWLLLTTFLLALFLGLCKRRYEITLLRENARAHRDTLFHYSSYLLDQMISVVTASTVVTYALYTMAKETILKFGTRFLGLTIPFVIYGIFRYLYLVHSKEEGGNPEKTMLTDKPLLADILLWVITAIVIIYLSHR